MKLKNYISGQWIEGSGNEVPLYIAVNGELVLMCEKQGFIPRYVTNIPQDKVDQTLADMNKYVYNLVTKDLGLGQQIETQLKKMRIHEEMEHDEETGNTQLTDQDHEDFYKSVFAQRRRDNNMIEEEI